MSPEQTHFFYQVMATILSTVGLGFLGLLWKFISAISELPRMRKGMRLLFERVEKLEQEAKRKDGT